MSRDTIHQIQIICVTNHPDFYGKCLQLCNHFPLKPRMAGYVYNLSFIYGIPNHG